LQDSISLLSAVSLRIMGWRFH